MQPVFNFQSKTLKNLEVTKSRLYSVIFPFRIIRSSNEVFPNKNLNPSSIFFLRGALSQTCSK